jgi:hypothetical protein
VDDDGCGEEALDGVRLHRLGDAHGVDAVDGDAGRAGDEGVDRTEHHQVDDRQREHDALPAPGLHDAEVAEHRRQDEQVVLAVHGALGTARRPARVGDDRRRVGVGARPVGPCSGAAALAPVGHRHQRAPPGLAGQDVGRRPVLAQQDRRAGVVEEVPLLGRCEVAVDAEPHGPEAPRGEEGEHELDPVGERAGDPVARRDPECGERTGGPADGLVELAVAQGGGPVDERLAVGVGRGCGVDDGVDRLGGARDRERTVEHQAVVVHLGHVGHRHTPDRRPRPSKDAALLFP